MFGTGALITTDNGTKGRASDFSTRVDPQVGRLCVGLDCAVIGLFVLLVRLVVGCVREMLAASALPDTRTCGLGGAKEFSSLRGPVEVTRDLSKGVSTRPLDV
jgi:Na+-translocating ferredoxin:NAD+ oxidoreductase RnfE subunit